jgi:hypothetical protein
MCSYALRGRFVSEEYSTGDQEGVDLMVRMAIKLLGKQNKKRRLVLTDGRYSYEDSMIVEEVKLHRLVPQLVEFLCLWVMGVGVLVSWSVVVWHVGVFLLAFWRMIMSILW